MEEWLSARAGRRVQDSRAAARRQARARRTGHAQCRAVVPHALQRDHGGAFRCARDAADRARPAGCSAAHRMLRHLDDPGQRDGGVDGRLRRRPDEEERLPEIPDQGWSGRLMRPRTVSRQIRPSESESEVRSPAGRLRRHARGRAAALSQGARRRRTVSGPDPDRRRQRTAVRRVRRARSRSASAISWRSASRRRKKCCSRATGRIRSCSPENDPALLLIAAHPRRGAPVRGDVPPQGAVDARSAVGSSTRCRASARDARRALLTTFGSLAGVRRATREELTPSSAARPPPR